MTRFKVVTPEGVSFGPPGVGYESEMEALGPIGAEIVEIPPGSEEDFIRAARDADALYVKARRITKRMIDGLERCRVISLGMVGVDSVDVAAATARGIPVTNVPDTFIEEVADHALMLILATYRRLTLMDRYVRDGRWAEGRPYLSQFPRLWGQTLGLDLLRARGPGGGGAGAAVRAPDHRLRSLRRRDRHDPARRRARGPDRPPAPLGHRLHARPGDGGRLPPPDRRALPADEAGGAVRQHRAGPDGGRGGARQGARGRVDRRSRAGRVRAGAGHGRPTRCSAWRTSSSLPTSPRRPRAWIPSGAAAWAARSRSC